MKSKKLKDGSHHVTLDMPVADSERYYKLALKTKSITVQDLIYQSKVTKDSLKAALIGAMVVKLLEQVVKTYAKS